MGLIVNYGSCAYGTRKLTIGGTVYIGDNCRVSRPSKTIANTTELGCPGNFVLVTDRITGSAQLQISSTGTKPQLGATFTETFDSSIGVETFVVTQVEDTEDQNSPRKVNVTFMSTAYE